MYLRQGINVPIKFAGCGKSVVIKMKKIRIDILLFCVSFMCFFVYAIISYNNSKVEGNAIKIKHKLQEISETESEKKQLDNTEITEIPYAKLYEKNNDMVGWLYIPNTIIDYPVVQTMQDEEYYLYRDFFGEDDKNGTLFLDTDSELNNPYSVLMIHGHHMKSGAMFGRLSDFLEEDYLKKHSQIYFYIKDKINKYDIISVFTSKIYNQETDKFAYYNYFSLKDKQVFEEYYKNIKELSLYDTGVIAEYGDEFIVLSTCSYHTKNGRLVVVGKRVND